MMNTFSICRSTLVIFLIMLFLTGCAVHVPYFYSAESIEAWIVDEDTKEPLEGVVVVAEWILQWHTIAGRQPVGQLKVMETVTDKYGHFYFPAWGPEIVLRGRLDNETPRLIIFKIGYRDDTKTNDMFEKQSGSTRRSDWDGEVIPLPKFKGSLEEYADHLSRLSSMLGYAFRSPNGECQWKKIPHMVVALHKQKAIFEQNNVSNMLNSIEDLAKRSPKSCNQSQSFFRSYLS